MQKPKVVVVMPAYNAQKTIEKTWREVVAHDVVDLVIVVDDASQDEKRKTQEMQVKFTRTKGKPVQPANLGSRIRIVVKPTRDPHPSGPD